MVLRALIAATPLLVAACFVDNRPVGASASASSSDASSDTASSTGAPTTGTPPSTTTLATTTSESSSTGTSGDTGTTDPGTSTTADPITDPATTEAPPLTCAGHDQLGGGVGMAACGECVTTHCCEPFDDCAANDECVSAWSCIIAEPCESKWPSCPGALGALTELKQISDCFMGPCAEVCLISCAPQTAACAASKACSGLEACVAACARKCAPNDLECLHDCTLSCTDAFPEGVELLQAKTACQNPDCG